MNKLLADLTVLYTKLHTFHYNVVGKDFAAVHVFLEGEYNAVHELIDETAENLKIEGKYPLATIKEMLEITTITEAEARDYTSAEVFAQLIVDYKAIVNEIEALKEEVPFYQTNFLEDVQTSLLKKLWFLEATTK